jgi:hypothetical protein
VAVEACPDSNIVPESSISATPKILNPSWILAHIQGCLWNENSKPLDLPNEIPKMEGGQVAKSSLNATITPPPHRAIKSSVQQTCSPTEELVAVWINFVEWLIIDFCTCIIPAKGKYCSAATTRVAPGRAFGNILVKLRGRLKLCRTGDLNM